MALATNLGFPRMGARRELKKAMESYWSGAIDEATLLKEAAHLRQANWALQRQIGLDHIPSNDFSLYDQVLDMMLVTGAIPARFKDRFSSLVETTYAMARGVQNKTVGHDLAAMEMTKWFDTNYHYIVPEFERGMEFQFLSKKPVDEFREARAMGLKTRPVLIGPVTFLRLGKSKQVGFDRFDLLPKLVAVYQSILSQLSSEGAEWIQIDEPCLALDALGNEAKLFESAYAALKKSAGSSKLLLTSYFDRYGENLPIAARLPVDGLHIDLTRASADLSPLLDALPPYAVLSAGIVDGRNIWRNDLEKSLDVLKTIQNRIGTSRLWVAPSCSLLHVPVNLELEQRLNSETKSWMAFAKQKLDEIKILARALNDGETSVEDALRRSDEAVLSRRHSPFIKRSIVRERVSADAGKPMNRATPFAKRQQIQKEKLKLPLFPTTTIGSFPQTSEIRTARRDFKNGSLREADYRAAMQKEIKRVVDEQEKLGLDVLVHGEPERNDMVEYFGEQLDGFAFTENGWVQSYGSRCVKPPVIFGDVVRSKPMTLEWIAYAQSLTKIPMKGMLTGPITILQWSFVRDDQPRSQTAAQIAYAIRDEVADLEKAGIGIIQIDEAAIREGLPLRRADWPAYFNWAVRCFHIASSGVNDRTQIHTHMCYSEFNDMIEAIVAMDADVITIESSRSGLELLEALKKVAYPNEIGPGVYDIHSPRVPSVSEIVQRLDLMRSILPEENIWVNPDCGLKTRGWAETIKSLENMVAAATEHKKRAHRRPLQRDEPSLLSGTV